MAITDFNKLKKLDVADVTDQPTISRTVPLKITSGDDSTTGTGEIVLDWTDIASKADIGIYDENDNLLDYYFESFDDSDEEAVIWVFRDWVQDGSTQLKIAYGDGPSDQSVSASTVFDKESDLKAEWLLNEDSGDALDVTSNNNDGTVHGATQGETGIVNGAYSLDGSDDYIEVEHDDSQNITGQLSIFAWVDISSLPDSDKRYPILSKRGGSFSEEGNNEDSYHLIVNDNGGLEFGFNNGGWQGIGSSSSIVSAGKHRVGITFDESEAKFYVDGVVQDTKSLSESLPTYSVPLYLGVDPDAGKGYFTDILDNVELHSKIISEDEEAALYSATKSSPDFFSQQAAEDVITDPEVTTNSASDVDTESAKLNGTLDSLGGESSVDVYFEWGETDSYSNTTSAQSKSSTGSFSETLSLTAGRAYHYRAVVTDGTDIWYGEDQQFITVIPARVHGESRLLADALEWDPSAFYVPPMQTESSLRASVQIGLYVSAPAIRGMAMLKTTGAQAQKVFAAPVLSAESRLLASAIFDIQIPAPVIESESRLHAETKVRNWPPELTESQNISTSRRPFAIAYDGRTAFDMGPVRRKDASEGLYARAWRLRVDGNDCWLAVANEENDEWIEDFIEFSLDDSTGATSFDLTFDQNGRPFVCWEQDGRVWIYYYDPFAEEMTKRDVCAGRTPRTRLDVRRDRLSGESDILLFYLDDDEDCLKYRVQSDRYDDAYAISRFNDVENKYLEILAMASNRRMYLWYSIYDPADDFWVLCCWHSAPYPYVMEDENVAVAGDSVLSAVLRTEFIRAATRSSEIAINSDAVLSAKLQSAMQKNTLSDENIVIDGDSVLDGALRKAIWETVLDDEECALDGDSVLSAERALKILKDTLDDENIGMDGDSILSATITNGG